MKSTKPAPPALKWSRALIFALAAILVFHASYASATPALLRILVICFPICLIQLARLNTARQSFYTGLLTACGCVAPQLICFWKIFGPAAVLLWLVLAFWTGLFVLIAHLILRRFGNRWALLLLPFVWTGLEYFRSELYYLKFSWLNIGYVFAGWPTFLIHAGGMYGLGFLAAVGATLFQVAPRRYASGYLTMLILAIAIPSGQITGTQPEKSLQIAGVQMEFPVESEIPKALDTVAKLHPDAQLFVLSEYTLDGPIPRSLRNWCRTQHKYLLVGGKEPAPHGNFYDTGFVIGPDGETVFQQGKSIPIPLFKDGLPASDQRIWNSPWGNIGICICYDLSFTRVTDRLVKMGAQLLIVPTMDVTDWGQRQHELHALVAPIRASEYGIPIFRLASSGISQAVNRDGKTIAHASFPGQNEIITAQMQLAGTGTLPFDRWLAPFSVVVTGLTILGLTAQNFLNRKNRNQNRDNANYAKDPSPSLAKTHV